MTTRANIESTFRALPGVVEVTIEDAPGVVSILVERCGDFEIGDADFRELARLVVAVGVTWTVRVRSWRWRLSRWAWRRWHPRVFEPRIAVIESERTR